MGETIFDVGACRAMREGARGGAAEPAHERPMELRPFYTAIGIVTLAFFASVSTRNDLWTWYTLLGLGLLLGATGFARGGRLRLEPRAAWLLALVLSMHYLGGSLSGLHRFGGVNGLYYAFPWWDNAVHALGAAAVAVAAHAWLRDVRGLSPTAGVLLAVATASLVGVVVELYEFANFLAFGTVDQGFYTNTVLDLYYNVVGATLGALAHLRLTRRRAEDAPPVHA